MTPIPRLPGAHCAGTRSSHSQRSLSSPASGESAPTSATRLPSSSSTCSPPRPASVSRIVTDADACLAELRDLEDQGIHITAEICESQPEPENTGMFSLDLVGNDQPGIVHTITSLLAKHNISVHNLETSVESSSMAGGTIFRAKAQLQVPESTDISDLEHEIEDLANDLMVDINFES